MSRMSRCQWKLFLLTSIFLTSVISSPIPGNRNLGNCELNPKKDFSFFYFWGGGGLIAIV